MVRAFIQRTRRHDGGNFPREERRFFASASEASRQSQDERFRTAAIVEKSSRADNPLAAMSWELATDREQRYNAEK
jgi:hypothetical protein